MAKKKDDNIELNPEDSNAIDKELQKKIDDRRKAIMARAKKLDVDPSFVLVGGEKETVEFMNTGVYELDAILTDAANIENVGIPRGKIIEILGPSQSGKTWLCTQIMKQHQKKGERVLYVDAENTFYDVRFAQLGVNVSDPDLWEYIAFPAAEQNGMYMLDAAESGEYGVIILDSITALVPEVELTKDLSDAQKIGAHAMFVNRFLKRMLPKVKHSNTTFYFINQKRVGAGAMPGTMSEQATGGKGVDYFTHIRLWMKALGGAQGQVTDEETGEVIGGRSEITIRKSRYHVNGVSTIVTVPFRDGESSPINDFVNRVTNNKKIESHVMVKRKEYLYYDPTDVNLRTPLAKSKDKVEWIKQLIQAPAPAKLKKGDTTSKTAFDYLAFILKMNERDVKNLMVELEEGKNEAEVAESIEKLGIDTTGLTHSGFYEDDEDIEEVEAD